MMQFAFAPLFRVPPTIDLKEDVPVEFAFAGEQRFEIRSTFVKTVCQVLAEEPERAIGFTELLEEASRRAKLFLAESLAGQPVNLERSLANEMLRLLQRGAVEIYAEPAPVSSTVPHKPAISELVRYLAANAEFGTNRLHQAFSFDPLARHILAACDGTQTVDEIVTSLRAKFATGALVLREAGEAVTGERLDAMLVPKVTAMLRELAGHGVFTAPGEKTAKASA
jgi:methyltransferase-like protein